MTASDIRIPHANLNTAINGDIVRSEIEGGVFLRDLPCGTAIEVRTHNRSYKLIKQDGEQALISGHPQFCPVPVLVTIDGSNWGGSLLKRGFIGRGMRLEFRHPIFRRVTTSPINEIREVA